MRSPDRRNASDNEGSTASTAPHPGKSKPQPGTIAAKAKTPHVVGTAANVPRIQLSAVEGGAQNVDLTHINDHPGFDADRIGKRGKPFKTTHATRMYQSNGAPIAGAEIPAHAPVFINAGAITEIALATSATTHSKAQACVYIFDYNGHSGWIPANHVPHEAVHDQHEIAAKIEDQRDDKDHEFGHGTPIRTDATPQGDGVENLFTYPHQVPPQNMAKYYYGNLSLNLPDTGGQRVGVIADNIPGAPAGHPLEPYRVFYAEQPHKEAGIPLYAQGERHPSGKFLHFVYGFVKTDAGARIYGWINKSMLKAGFDPRPKK